MTNKKLILIAITIVILVSFFAMMPTLSCEFVNWDDPAYVINEPDITNLSFANIKKMATSFYCATYVPITMLSYAIEYHFAGETPFLYHLDNLILHLLSCGFVFWFFFLLYQSIATHMGQSAKNEDCKQIKLSIVIAFVVALLFGIHPLHVESVAWVTERKDTLYAFFYLASLIAYVKYLNSNLKTQNLKLLIFSFLLFSCSLLSKSMAVTLPVIMLLIDYLLHRKMTFKTILEKVPFFICSIIIGLIAIYGQRDAKGMLGQELFSDRIILVCHDLMFYIWKTFVPTNLSAVYSKTALGYLCVISIIATIIIISGTLFSLKKTRKFLFGLAFFIITIAPTLSGVGAMRIADRFHYVPSIGLFFIVALFFIWLLKKKNKAVRFAIFIAFISVITLFSVLTYKRCYIWKNDLNLWNDTINKTSDSSLAFICRGNVYMDNFLYTNAILDYNCALAINPRKAKVYGSRGMAYQSLNKFQEALADYSMVLAINPNNMEALFNRAMIFKSMNAFKEGIADFSRAIQLDTNKKTSLISYKSRGLMYAKSGDIKSALQDFSKVIKLEPNNLINYYQRGLAYNHLGQYENAITDFNHILVSNPNDGSALNNRGIAFLKLKKIKEAKLDFIKAIKNSLNNESAKINLEILEKYERNRAN